MRKGIDEENGKRALGSYTAFKSGALPTGTDLPHDCNISSRYVITLPGSAITPITGNCSS